MLKSRQLSDKVESIRSFKQSKHFFIQKLLKNLINNTKNVLKYNAKVLIFEKFCFYLKT